MEGDSSDSYKEDFGDSESDSKGEVVFQGRFTDSTGYSDDDVLGVGFHYETRGKKRPPSSEEEDDRDKKKEKKPEEEDVDPELAKLFASDDVFLLFTTWGALNAESDTKMNNLKQNLGVKVLHVDLMNAGSFADEFHMGNEERITLFRGTEKLEEFPLVSPEANIVAAVVSHLGN